MLARNAFEFLEAFKLALEWPVILECAPPNYLGRAQHSRSFASGEPYFAVSPIANTPEQFVVRHRRIVDASRITKLGEPRTFPWVRRAHAVPGYLRFAGWVHEARLPVPVSAGQIKRSAAELGDFLGATDDAR